MAKRIVALYKLLHVQDIKKELYSNGVYITCKNMFDVEKAVMKLFNKHKNDPDNRVVLFRKTILQAENGHTFEDERKIAVFDVKNVIEGGSFFL